MTKSTITRERLAKIKSWRETYGAGSNVMLPAEEAEELARIALAAMDSEPVALQPELAKVIYHFRDWNEGFPVERFKADYVISWMLANYPPAQPAPVVHGEVARAIEELKRTLVDCNRYNYCSDAVARVEVACRAAMLQAGNSPAQSDCCPAQNVVAPAQIPIDHGYLPECECSGCKATARICTEMAVNSLVIPNEMTSEQAYEIGYCYGDPVDVFARGANWMRQHIIDSTLAAAPQKVK